MESVIQYVHQHPPRCVIGLRPKPTSHSNPTIRLPSHLSVYGGLYDSSHIASFLIGCPCGHQSAYLLGYYVNIEPRAEDTIFVGPLSLECPKCRQVTAFFDTRKHGYDGEQGINTHMIGEGNPHRFACPDCGVTPLILCVNFSYQGTEDLKGNMRQRLQDFFEGVDIVGQCTQCTSLIEITSFECA
jgi:hypothetical protein